MTPKTFSALFIATFLLLGCANSGHYPITGQSVGINDQVKYMTAPVVANY
ncbi:MAG: hypothetical protein WBV71_04310 [Roseobacter sp.]